MNLFANKRQLVNNQIQKFQNYFSNKPSSNCLKNLYISFPKNPTNYLNILEFSSRVSIMESKQTAFSSSYKKYENLLGTTPQQMDNKTNLNSYLFFSSHLNSMVANHRQCQRRNNFQDSSKSPSEPIFNLNNSYMSDSFTSSFDCSEQTGTLNESFLNLSMATNNATGSDQDGNHLVYLKSKNKQYILSNSHLISSKHKSLRRTESGLDFSSNENL